MTNCWDDKFLMPADSRRFLKIGVAARWKSRDVSKQAPKEKADSSATFAVRLTSVGMTSPLTREISRLGNSGSGICREYFYWVTVAW
jgi:hypothetical protein